MQGTFNRDTGLWEFFGSPIHHKWVPVLGLIFDHNTKKNTDFAHWLIHNAQQDKMLNDQVCYRDIVVCTDNGKNAITVFNPEFEREILEAFEAAYPAILAKIGGRRKDLSDRKQARDQLKAETLSLEK
jgi:hypothetical protein